MLDEPPGARAEVIARRLAGVARQIIALRNQQRLLVSLHQDMSRRPLPPLLDKAAWVEMLRQAGMDEKAMMRWHREFEHRAPQEHEQFLASLGIAPEEIRQIRRHSRGPVPSKPPLRQRGVHPVETKGLHSRNDDL
jgi:hypothetical protein